MAITPSDIVTLINATGRGDPPSALADVFVNPLVKVIDVLDAKGDLAEIRQTIDDIIATLRDSSEITRLAAALGEEEDVITASLQAGLDEIASNFGLVRRAAAPSRGSVLLLRTQALVSPIQVRSGTRVSALSINQDYRITESVLISSMTFDASLNSFIFSVPVESVNVGATTVAATGQISTIKDGIAGINGVTNSQPVVGGRDTESDADLADRTKTTLSANNIGTRSGYRILILEQDEVKDVSVVGAGDPLMVRDLGDGGSVDIYVADAIPVSITETTSAANTVIDTFTPSRQPIIDDVSTISVTGFSPTTTTIIKDGSVFAGSTKSKDTIVFDVNPPIGASTITYQVNDLIDRQQTFIDDPERKILGADVLIKEAVVALVDVIFRIVVLPGFVGAVVKNEVETEVTKFIADLGIGQDLEQSDVINIVTNIDGVDRIDLPLTKFDKQSGSGSLNTIAAGANEILRPGTIQANL